jgi:hypothetical protein
MPKSKRAKVGESVASYHFAHKLLCVDAVSLTKVAKKTKEHKESLITEVRQFRSYATAPVMTSASVDKET